MLTRVYQFLLRTSWVSPRGRIGVLIGGMMMVGLQQVDAVIPGEGTRRDASEGWSKSAAFLINDAYAIFKSRGDSGAGREYELGAAVALMNVQPRTVGNLLKAKAELERLCARGQSDLVAVSAKYFLARLHAHYEFPGKNHAEAKRLYKDLLSKHSGNALAENAASALVLIELYENIELSERALRFAELEKLGSTLKTSTGGRGFHLIMGYAYIDFQPENANEHALRHLLKADGEGFSRKQTEAAGWIAIAELAEAEGQVDVAIAYYRKFLKKYERDDRHFAVRSSLERLIQENPEPSVSP